MRSIRVITIAREHGMWLHVDSAMHGIAAAWQVDLALD